MHTRPANGPTENGAPRNGDAAGLAARLAAEIERGIAVIARIDDEAYRKSTTRSASVGAQFRHNLDFVNGFLGGVGAGRIDYNDRERDPIVESDRGYAIGRFRNAVGSVSRLRGMELRKIVRVRSETDANVWHLSSVARELEFVLSHTIHHHGLIAEKLAASGGPDVPHFGVAPSTLEFWKKRIEAPI